ncbi:MAG: transcription elongation factor GreA [Parcubacteria group bacterium]|nr:transcription elongation factor GreA [Parcubacteria group bacterium]
MNSDIHYLTTEGQAKLLAELEELKAKRKATTLRIEEAIKMGDLSENAEYSDAKEEQAFIEGRISEIESILKTSEIIKKKRSVSETVVMGSTITVKAGKVEKQFTIVGTEESDPAQGRISHESPLGKAFLDRKKGDKVTVETPRGTIEYLINEIA